MVLGIVILWLACFAYNAIYRLSSSYYYGWLDFLAPLIVAVAVDTGALIAVHYLMAMNTVLLVVFSNLGVIISSYLGLFLGRAMLRSLPKRDIWSMRFD